MAVTYLLRGTKDVKKVYVHVSKGRNGLKVVRPTNLSIDIAYWDNTTKRAVMPKGSNKMKSIDKKLLQNKIDKFNAIKGKHKTKINTSNLENGLYFIHVKTNEGSGYNKFIINK